MNLSVDLLSCISGSASINLETFIRENNISPNSDFFSSWLEASFNSSISEIKSWRASS